MFNDVFYFALVLGLFLTLYSIIATIVGLKLNNNNFLVSASNADIVRSGFIVISYIGLTIGFVNNDFSLSFVKDHSSVDLPLFYKITGAWGGMDGSLLLWAMILSVITSIIYFQYRNIYRQALPHSVLVLNFILLFLLFLLVGWSNPLSRIFPIPENGRGLNPLLQDPGMVFHPPSLYLGFITLSVPFAFAIGSMLSGKLNNDWILLTRRWTLLGWFFLTLGMFIGGQWAYHELGWGGYWAWDPVENSSFMPWLLATAFLHSVMVQEKRNVLKIWNIVLIILTFELTMVGTFITRSGLLNSVHAFAQSEIGPAFLIFIGISLSASFALLIYRLPLLESKDKGISKFSKENAFVFNNVLFFGICFGIFYGTLFPLIAEGLFNKKLSIQAPFFNAVNLPLAMMLITLMSVTPFIAWKNGSIKKLGHYLLPVLAISILIAVAVFLFITSRWEVVMLSGILYFGFHSILLELSKTFRTRAAIKAKKENPSSFSYLFRDRRKWGGMLIHLGVLVAFLGFMGNFFKEEKDVVMKPGDVFEIGEYNIHYKEEVFFQERNVQHRAGLFEIYSKGEFLTVLRPSKAFYPTAEEPITEVAIYRTLREDLYLSPSSFNKDSSATLTIFVNPMIIFVQSSLLFFLAGVLLCFTYKSPKLKAIESNTINNSA